MEEDFSTDEEEDNDFSSDTGSDEEVPEKMVRYICRLAQRVVNSTRKTTSQFAVYFQKYSHIRKCKKRINQDEGMSTVSGKNKETQEHVDTLQTSG